jgi:hypothetical protein
VHDVTGRTHMLFQDAFMTRPGSRLPAGLNQCTQFLGFSLKLAMRYTYYRLQAPLEVELKVSVE